MNKNHILDEIKRTAHENGGSALGKERFYAETGIKESDWLGKYWARWGDALKEAGFEPNKMQVAYDENFLLDKFVSFIRELNHFPVSAEVRMKERQDATFPSHSTFQSRFRSKEKLVAKIVEYCNQRSGFEDVLSICGSVALKSPSDSETVSGRNEPVFGYVYLLKFGRHHKIGRTNALGRRERELAIQLPEKTRVVHKIKTDDPVGIEAYWHSRFANKRRNGEWFELDAIDLAAFKRRKFM